MSSKPLAVGLLAVGCVTAAAGGAYVAVRQNAEPAAAAPVAVAPATAAPLERAVVETEAVVAPERPLSALAAEPSVPAPTPRSVSKPARPRSERTSSRPAAPASRPERASAPPASAATTGPPPSVIAAPVRVDPPAAAIAEPVEVPRADPPAQPPAPLFEELVVPAESVIGLQVDAEISSERAQVEDRVEARVTRDVIVDGRTAIPAGSRALGTVTTVEQGGKMKGRARLGVRFHSLVLADGTQVPMRTEAIFREGESPGGESARKIGGAAVGGAIIGAIIGGKKGAVVGGATGAGAGTAVVMAGDRNPATLPAGTVVTVRLSAPVVIEVERQPPYGARE
jgi:hypothetical protein